jgi:Domain of unknown function (DUF1772)
MRWRPERSSRSASCGDCMAARLAVSVAEPGVERLFGDTGPPGDAEHGDVVVAVLDEFGEGDVEDVPLPLVHAITGLIARRHRPSAATFFFAAAVVVYVAGAMLLTLAVNVPMNDDLAATVIPTTPAEVQAVWDDYSRPWQRWNLVRPHVQRDQRPPRRDRPHRIRAAGRRLVGTSGPSSKRVGGTPSTVRAAAVGLQSTSESDIP